jgi:phosphatidylinositol 4-kinase
MDENIEFEHNKSGDLIFYDNKSSLSQSGVIFSETSRQQDERVRRQSPFGHLRTWRLIKVIVKSNDDVRQEQFAMQLIA